MDDARKARDSMIFLARYPPVNISNVQSAVKAVIITADLIERLPLEKVKIAISVVHRHHHNPLVIDFKRTDCEAIVNWSR